MSYRYFVIDVFTEQAFGGVPIAVFPDTSDVPHALYRTLASEMQSTDTVFMSPHRDTDRFDIRVFDNRGETTPGPHALLAGVSALLKAERIVPSNGKAAIKLETIDDCVSVDIDLSRKHCPVLISQTLDPSYDVYVPTRAELAGVIGLKEEDIASARYSTLIVSCGKPYLVIPLKSYHAVREAAFHQNDWARSSLPQGLIDSILLFAPNTDGKGDDFHSRLLEQSGHHNSDPAVAEAMPAFAAYLSQQKHVKPGTHSFSVRRGANDARQSHIHLEMDISTDGPLKLRIGGSAIASSRCEILV